MSHAWLPFAAWIARIWRAMTGRRAPRSTMPAPAKQREPLGTDVVTAAARVRPDAPRRALVPRETTARPIGAGEAAAAFVRWAARE